MWRMVAKEARRSTLHARIRRAKDWWVEKALSVVQWVTRDKYFAKRMMGFQTVNRDFNEANQLAKNAPFGDLSVMASREPLLAQAFDELWARVSARNSDGLSAMDLIECSAIIYEQILSHGRDGLEERLPGLWEIHSDTYRRAYNVAFKICGSRAPDIILPATALALRHSDPASAFPVFLSKLSQSQPGAERSEARALAEHPPTIPAAGRHLGTACNVRSKQWHNRRRYQIYDPVLDELGKRAWGVDEIDLLTEPSASEKLASFPFQIVTTDGPVRSELEMNEMARRLILGRLVLRTEKLPRFRKDAEKRFSERLHAGLAAVIDPLQGADEFAHLGYVHLTSGILDQAEVMYETALTQYEMAGSKEGMANAYFQLRLVHGGRKDLKQAEKMYCNSLELYESLGKQEGIARAAANLGVVHIDRKDWDKAEPLMRKALAIEEAEGLKEGMAVDYYNLSRIYIGRGNPALAAEWLVKALNSYEEVGDNVMVSRIKGELDELEKVRLRKTTNA
jgi:tetratricopeptide (TPR) repeat protein